MKSNRCSGRQSETGMTVQKCKGAIGRTMSRRVEGVGRPGWREHLSQGGELERALRSAVGGECRRILITCRITRRLRLCG